MILLIGSVAGIITSLGFLPQIIKILQTGNSKDVSILQPLMLSVGISLWLIYGILLQELPIILANSFSLACNLLLVIFKLKERA